MEKERHVADAAADVTAGQAAPEAASHVAHTATPWHVGPHYRHDVESREGRICECYVMGSPRAEANAAFIVLAVNCHDELLAALKEITEILASWGAHQCPGFDCAVCQGSRLQEIARAAIAKAEQR